MKQLWNFLGLVVTEGLDAGHRADGEGEAEARDDDVDEARSVEAPGEPQGEAEAGEQAGKPTPQGEDQAPGKVSTTLLDL